MSAGLSTTSAFALAQDRVLRLLPENPFERSLPCRPRQRSARRRGPGRSRADRPPAPPPRTRRAGRGTPKSPRDHRSASAGSRALYDVTRAEGPERIAIEWWREDGLTRYYRVEDTAGRRVLDITATPSSPADQAPHAGICRACSDDRAGPIQLAIFSRAACARKADRVRPLALAASSIWSRRPLSTETLMRNAVLPGSARRGMSIVVAPRAMALRPIRDQPSPRRGAGTGTALPLLSSAPTCCSAISGGCCLHAADHRTRPPRKTPRHVRKPDPEGAEPGRFQRRPDSTACPCLSVPLSRIVKASTGNIL